MRADNGMEAPSVPQDRRLPPPPSADIPQDKKARQRANNEAALMALLHEVGEVVGCPAVLELQFHPTRRWRFDSAFPEKKVALEVEGGIWTGGGHTRPIGFLKDIEKYNEAGILGWRVFRATWKQVKDGTARDVLLRAMGVEGA